MNLVNHGCLNLIPAIAVVNKCPIQIIFTTAPSHGHGHPCKPSMLTNSSLALGFPPGDGSVHPVCTLHPRLKESIHPCFPPPPSSQPRCSTHACFINAPVQCEVMTHWVSFWLVWFRVFCSWLHIYVSTWCKDGKVDQKCDSVFQIHSLVKRPKLLAYDCLSWIFPRCGHVFLCFIHFGVGPLVMLAFCLKKKKIKMRRSQKYHATSKVHSNVQRDKQLLIDFFSQLRIKPIVFYLFEQLYE